MSSSHRYKTFLEAKQIQAKSAGIAIATKDINPILFGFQRDIVVRAVSAGKYAIFSDCGTGKSFMQCEWAHQVQKATGGNVLILAPLAVAQQTIREAAKLGIEIQYCRKQSQFSGGIAIANYEMLEHFDVSQFAGVVLDECFAAGTEIDVIDVDNTVTKKHIEDVRVGDKIINASGIDFVADVHRREVSYAVRLTIAGRSIVCSPNHPFFTQRGWVGAQDLVPGDQVASTLKAMRLVRNDLCAEIHQSKTSAVLREILLSEMADESARAYSESTYARGRGEARESKAAVVCVGESQGGGGEGENSPAQPNIRSIRTGEDLPPIERDKARTFRAWGQRNWFDQAATDTTGCTRRELDTGICFVTGQTDSRLSNALQDRLSKSRAQNSYRSGWVLPRESQSSGHQEGFQAGFARVESLEILEPGNNELEQYRDADGKLYFYDLGAARHPSFSVNGLLVHNSSILKSYSGKIRNQIIESFASTPYRLACSATPSPNDVMELGNHAEFLGVMNRTEMLSMFFVHDGGETQKWRLKGHAESEFWKWVCTWAVMLRKPSDLGYSDEGFELPELVMHSHVVESDLEPEEGMLFALEAKGLLDRRQARRASLNHRVAKAAELANNSNEPWLIWCDLNDEGDALEEAIADSIQISGSDTAAHKESAMFAFANGELRVLISKPSICGFGMNWQHCNNVVFVGLSDSYEQFYQAIRRCWRFGQTKTVNCHVIYAEAEGAVIRNIERKEQEATRMGEEMVKQLQLSGQQATAKTTSDYNPTVEMIIPDWIRGAA